MSKQLVFRPRDIMDPLRKLTDSIVTFETRGCTRARKLALLLIYWRKERRKWCVRHWLCHSSSANSMPAHSRIQLTKPGAWARNTLESLPTRPNMLLMLFISTIITHRKASTPQKWMWTVRAFPSVFYYNTLLRCSVHK